MPRYAPTVTIKGVAIAGSWDGSSRVALDELTFTWGRTDLYEDPDPTKAVIELIDPSGLWATDPSLYGAALLVTRPLGTVFRGTIDAISLAPLVVYNPATDRQQQVWRVRLDAIDPTADLGKTVPVGMGPNATPNSTAYNYSTIVNGPYEWQVAYAATRIDALSARALSIVNGISRFTGDAVHFIRLRKMAENLSFMDHIRECYNVVPLSHPNYYPGDHKIGRAGLAPSTGVALYQDGYTIRIRPLVGYAIPASQIAHTTDGLIASALSENIATVAVNHAVMGAIESATVGGVGVVSGRVTDDAVAIVAVPNVASNGGHNTLEVQTPILDDATYPAAQRPAALAAAVALAVSQLNGKIPAPPVQFDLERFDYGASVDALLLSTFDQPMPLYLTGAIYNALANFGPLFQLTGGTLTYRQGWTLDAHLAPAMATAATLIVAALVTNPDRVIADYDPTISLADLGHVTQGLA